MNIRDQSINREGDGGDGIVTLGTGTGSVKNTSDQSINYAWLQTKNKLATVKDEDIWGLWDSKSLPSILET